LHISITIPRTLPAVKGDERAMLTQSLGRRFIAVPHSPKNLGTEVRFSMGFSKKPEYTVGQSFGSRIAPIVTSGWRPIRCVLIQLQREPVASERRCRAQGSYIIELENIMALPNQALDQFPDLAEHLEGIVIHRGDYQNSHRGFHAIFTYIRLPSSLRERQINTASGNARSSVSALPSFSHSVPWY